MINLRVCSAFLAGLALAQNLTAMEVPSRPVVDAPELARLGELAVGVRTQVLVDHNAVDVVGFDPKSGQPPRRDRALTIDIWYPANVAANAIPETYKASLPGEPPAPPVAFSIPGLAVRDAVPIKGHYPLVIVSHGYGNATVAMSWLTENLASKGYVVAAIRHEDPYYPSGFAQVLLRRPLDISFVARALQQSLGAEGLIDATRTALVGYSMGGYGVLTAAGATLDPNGQAVQRVPAGQLLPYAAGGKLAGTLRVNNLKAVVAISPAGGALGAWGTTGLRAITAPLLLISGDHDHTVDYSTGARAFFVSATGAKRYLLTFLGGGHALGLGPAPDEMRRRLWDFEWFEDPVWRKDRIVAINLHMITAFLSRYLKGDESRAPYLDVQVPLSSSGQWTDMPPTPYDAFSPGTTDLSLWKGFQRKHAEGLELLQLNASAETP